MEVALDESVTSLGVRLKLMTLSGDMSDSSMDDVTSETRESVWLRERDPSSCGLAGDEEEEEGVGEEVEEVESVVEEGKDDPDDEEEEEEEEERGRVEAVCVS